MKNWTKAEKSLDALEKLSAPHCKVIRDGETRIIESRELVVGDIVIIETGDNVPADLRLIESAPVEKDADAVLPEDAPIGDRINMAYSSCSVTSGQWWIVIGLSFGVLALSELFKLFTRKEKIC